MVIVFFVVKNEREKHLSYKNGKNILPDPLLKKIQQYINGETIYIPAKDESRSGWGEKNGTKSYLANRNKKIYSKYIMGVKMEALGKEFHLSKDSIKKIIYQHKKKL